MVKSVVVMAVLVEEVTVQVNEDIQLDLVVQVVLVLVLDHMLVTVMDHVQDQDHVLDNH